MPREIKETELQAETAHYYSVLGAFALGTPSQTVPQTWPWSKVVPLQSQMCCLETGLECNPIQACMSYSTKSKQFLVLSSIC